MVMTAPVRKLALTAHVTASVGWLGALAVFLAHGLISLTSRDVQVIRAPAFAMDLTAWAVILPLGLASLTTGLVQALGTAWGLVRHYWVLFKLLLTTVATIVLLLKLSPISALADGAMDTAFSSANLVGLRISLAVHAGGGLLVLLAAVTLAIYKPVGMTPYGLRRQRGEAGLRGAPADLGGTTTPVWVKAFGAVVGILFLLVVVMLLGGGHGPGAHVPAG